MVKKIEQESKGDLGNTKTKSQKQDTQTKHWSFTYNNYDKNKIEQIEQTLNTLGRFIFQEETGEGGTPHLQGYICFHIKKRLSECKKINNAIHWEKCRGNQQQNIDYCSKKETRTGKIFSNFVPILQDPLEGLMLYPFQQEILDLCKTIPNNRTINWYWDENGNIGKTTLAKHICINYNALYITGKSNDIKYAISQYIQSGKKLDVVIFDFVRSMEEFISYEAIEAVKNGIFFSGKYEGGMCIFNSPHVFILANFPPVRSRLSTDRWNIIEIHG